MALFIVMKFWLVSFFVSCPSTRYVQLHYLALDGPIISISLAFAIGVKVSMDVYIVKVVKTKKTTTTCNLIYVVSHNAVLQSILLGCINDKSRVI